MSLLETIQTGYKNSSRFVYGRLTDPELYTRENNAKSPLFDVHPAGIAISEIRASNGIGEMNSIQYKYEGSKYHLEKGSFGFHKVRVLNKSKNMETVTEFFQEKDIVGSPKKVEQFYEGVKIKEMESEYLVEFSSPHGIKNIRSVRQFESDFDEIGNLIKTSTTTYEDYDSFGNAEKSVITHENAEGKQYTKTVKTRFWNDEINWLLGKPLKIKVSHTAPEQAPQTRTTEFVYDSKTGALVLEILEPGNPLNKKIAFKYDSFGNKTEIRKSGNNVKSRIFKQEFGENGLFLLKETNSLGHSLIYEYDPLCGLPTRITEPNGLSTVSSYDVLCRKISETLPNGTETKWFYEWSEGYNAGLDYEGLGLKPADFSVYKKVQRTEGVGENIVYYDSLGREVRTINPASHHKRIFQDSIYNSQGLLHAQTNPYFEGKFANDGSFWTIYEYDSRGRKRKIISPNRNEKIETLFSYEALKTKVTDPVGRTKTTVVNILGKKTEIFENGKSAIKYAYDPIGNLIQTDALGYITRMAYDSFGNRVKMEDPSMGIWTYEYNSFGELIRQTDAKGQVQKLTYDSLGRLIQREEPEGKSLWQYDTAEKGIGKLASESSPETSKTYTYDRLGRLKDVNLNVGDENFKTSFEYDSFSRPKKETRPDGVEIIREYDNVGMLKRVSIPKKHIWDYDYLALEDSMEKVLKQIAELEEEAAVLEKTAKELIEKAESFQKISENLHTRGNNYEQYAQAFLDYSRSMKAWGNYYQYQANYYRNLSNFYWGAFGNQYLKFWKSSGGYYFYKTDKKCVSKNWKGHCKHWRSYYTRVPSRLIDDQRKCKTSTNWKGSSTSSCWYGPPSRLHLGRYFGAKADSFQQQANHYYALANRYQNYAQMYLMFANLFKSWAAEYQEQAKEYYAQAREQTDQLAKVVQSLETYKHSRDEIQVLLDERKNDETLFTIWSATGRNAYGKITGEVFGNGKITEKFYDPASGRLTGITTGNGTQHLIRDLHYEYDKVGNIVTRNYRLRGVSETFAYDNRDRLISMSRSGNGYAKEMLYSYDERGNMTFKSDAGQMVYDKANKLVKLISENGNEKTYAYDENGNMDYDGVRSIEWTSFNKPEEIYTDNSGSSFIYDGNRNRVRQDSYKNGKSNVLWYVGKGYEKIVEKDKQNRIITNHRHNIFVDGEQVAVWGKSEIEGQKTVDQARYVHRDSLGSIDTITEANGRTVAAWFYDPFGKQISYRKNPPQTETPDISGLDSSSDAATGNSDISNDVAVNGYSYDWSSRGYTGHEMLDSVELVHMNARLYDPLTGRFLSPDSYIQFETYSQNFNRYSYVLNNPLKYTDPTGHWVWFAVGAAVYITAATSDDKNIQQIGMLVGSALMFYGAGQIAGSAGIINPAYASAFSGALTGFTAGYISSNGKAENAWENAGYGALSAYLAFQVGHGFGKNLNWYSRAFAHGTVQGSIANARGGEFRSGFYAGAIGSAAGHYTQGIGGSGVRGIISRSLISGAIGGLASEASGGSFRNGATAAIIIHLFNDDGDVLIRRIKEGSNSTLGELTIEGHKGKKWYTLEPGGPDSKIEGFDKRIPEGSYKLGKFQSTKFKKQTYQIMHVSGRTYILIHSGNTHYHTKGCLMPGLNYSISSGEFQVSDSRKSFRQIMNILNSYENPVITYQNDLPY